MNCDTSVPLSGGKLLQPYHTNAFGKGLNVFSLHTYELNNKIYYAMGLWMALREGPLRIQNW